MNGKDKTNAHHKSAKCPNSLPANDVKVAVKQQRSAGTLTFPGFMGQYHSSANTDHFRVREFFISIYQFFQLSFGNGLG